MPAETNLEMILTPFEVYITTGTDAFPAIASTPSGGWTLLGKNGKRNQVEGGVTLHHDQTVVMHHTEGHTEPVKASRSRESFRVTFSLSDVRAGLYTHALAGNAVATGSGTDTLPLGRSLEMQEVKLLIRGRSPVHAQGNAQYEVPRAVQTGSPTVNPHKGGLAALAFEFQALGDPDASATGERIGRLKYASTVPS